MTKFENIGVSIRKKAWLCHPPYYRLRLFSSIRTYNIQNTVKV